MTLTLNMTPKLMLKLTACVLMLPLMAQAETAIPAPANITVEDAYARSSNPKSGAAYMVLTNHGQTSCTLKSVSTDVADMADIHTMVEEAGVMKMAAADPVTLDAGASHSLTRGGDHVMLMGLHEALQNGQMLPLVFDFGDCGVLHSEIQVDNKRKPDADSAAHSSH